MIKCRWYVLHAYSGYEKKVADSIMDQASKLGISDHIEEVSVPTQSLYLPNHPFKTGQLITLTKAPSGGNIGVSTDDSR